ncbi:MAG: hypothetical protein ACLSVD_08660 [Eggerthellaceae bacterium]
MAQRMAARFEELGGTRAAAPVDRVVVEGGSAVGVVVDGETLPADAVIVTQDTLAAAFSLFARRSTSRGCMPCWERRSPCSACSCAWASQPT